MKQWNGLMKKEWVLMNGWLYGTAGASILVTLILPFVVSMFLGGSENALIIGLIPIWILISLILPVIVLLNSLKKETSRPDIWLHSPVSIFKLFGSKAVFAGFVGAMNLFLVIIVGLIQVRFTNLATYFTFNEVAGVRSVFAVAPVFFLVSLMAMCIGLLLVVLSNIIKPYVKTFTTPIMVAIFFAGAWFLERLTESKIYQKIAAFGPIGGPLKDGFYIEIDNFFIGSPETLFYTGEILLQLSLAVLLFATAAVLFEKKVRL